MAGKNILAFFKSPEDAQNALKQLQSLKLTDSSINSIDGYPGEGIDHIDNPITGDFPGLGYLTLGGDFSDWDAGILAAASVSASGMSSGGPDNQMTGRNILLTVVVDEADFEKARQIVLDSGAII
jgi:hypothetical protein